MQHENTIDLIDQDEAAKALNVSPLTLKAARLGRLKPGHPLQSLPHVRIGKRPMYRKADIAALIERNLVTPEEAVA